MFWKNECQKILAYGRNISKYFEIYRFKSYIQCKMKSRFSGFRSAEKKEHGERLPNILDTVNEI